MRSVVLFSGGLDSTTVLAYALNRGDEVWPLTIQYGQHHTIELERAQSTLEKYGLLNRYREITLDLSFLTGCSLINRNLAIPDAPAEEIPSTYVPSRNLIFLAYASSYAESILATRIMIGVNALDYSGYPDCRPEFIAAFSRAIEVGTKEGVEQGLTIEAPLQNLSKREIIALGTNLQVDYALTHSCYNPWPDGAACGICDSCRLRLKGFSEAGSTDPVLYRKRAV